MRKKMNGSPIARSIYYTTNNSNKVNGDSTKNRGDNLKHAPEAATSISSHYTPFIRLSKVCPCVFLIFPLYIVHFNLQYA